MSRTVQLASWLACAASAPVEGRVLTPNRRAAAALGVPPLSLESLARQTLRHHHLSPIPAIQAHRLLVTLAATTLGAAEPDSVARTLAPAVRALFRAAADLDALVAHAPPRTARVATLALAYRNALRAHDLYDDAEALQLAATKAPAPEVIHLRGYPRLGQDERAFLAAIAADGSTAALPGGTDPVLADNRDTAAYLRDRGWVIDKTPDLPAPFDALRTNTTTLAAHTHADMEAEVRWTLARIKQLLVAGASPDDLAIVARHDVAYGPQLLDVAWEYGVPVRALYAVPLAHTRLGTWLELVLDAAAQDLPFEATFRFLNHPLSPFLPPETHAKARQTHPAGLAAWRALDVDLQVLHWPASDTRGGWLQRLRGLIQAFGVRKRAARWPRDVQAVRTLVDGLEALLSPADEHLALPDLRRELGQALALLAVPAQPGRGGVELHTPLSIFGAVYRHVFVLGLAEGVLPAPVANSPVIDFHEREALQALGVTLEDAPAAARREQLAFLAMAHTARETLVLSYPRLYLGRPVVASPYFKALGLTPAEPPAVPAASLEQARPVWLAHGTVALDPAFADLDPAFASIAAALAVERRREGPGAPDAHDGLVGRPVDWRALTFSATQLTALGQCPFHWWGRYALQLAEPDEQEEEISAVLRGNLYHKALELAFADLPAGEDVRAAGLAKLEAAFDEAETLVNVPQLPSWRKRRPEHLRALRRAIEAEAFLAEGATILRREAPFIGTFHGLKVRGSVDRIDAVEGALELVDYKTRGSKPTGAKNALGEPKLDVQLPLYVAVAAPALYETLPVRKARYYSVTSAKDIAEADVGAVEELEALAGRVKGHLDAGHFPVEPDTGQKVCEFCALTAVCRRGPRLARKGATP